MDRFKWFDFLGALILLLSVTKSALAPQVSADSSDPTTSPTASVDQETHSFKFDFEETSDIQIGRSESLVGPLLDEGSSSLSSKGGSGDVVNEGFGKEAPSSNGANILCEDVWRVTEDYDSFVRFGLSSGVFFCDGSGLYLVDTVKLMGQ